MSARDLMDIYVTELTGEMPTPDELEQAIGMYKFNRDDISRNCVIVSCGPMALWLLKHLDIPRDFREDCLQAANLELFTAIDSWSVNGGSKWSTWALQAMKRGMLRERHRLYGPPAVDHQLMEEVLSDPLSDASRFFSDEEVASFPYVEGEAETRMEVAQLIDHISALPPRQREVVNHVLDGLRVAEAAREMGISRQTAHELYTAAIRVLRSFF